MANRKERDKKKVRMVSAREWADKQAQGGPSHLKMSEGVERYKLEPGKHDVDFMPFLAGKNNPSGDEGFGVFSRKYAAHRIPGLDGKPRLVICRSEFGKPCPACKIRNSGNSAIAEALKPTTRGLWLVNETPGKKPKWKVLDIYHYNRGMGFGELMEDAIHSLKEDDIEPFDLENGLTATLTVKEQSMPGNKFNAVTRIDFNSRDEQYDSGLLDKAPCLDEMLVDIGEEEMKRLISQGDTDSDSDDDDNEPKKPKKRDRDEEEDDEDEDDDTPRTKSGAKKDSEDEDMESTADDHGLEKGDLVMYRGEECEIKKISKDGTSLTLEDEDGDKITAVDPSKCKKIENPKDEDEDDDDDDSELEPKKKAKKKKVAKDEDDDDEDDSDLEPDEDDSELEPKKKKGKGRKKAEDDDDDDDDSELEPDDNEDEPKAKKKGKGKKKVDEDDDDDD